MILVEITRKRSRSAKICGPCSFLYEGGLFDKQGPQSDEKNRFMTIFYLKTSKLESLSPSSRWILFKNTGSGEVEREARQPRARQRHLRCDAPPDTRIMMSGLGLHSIASL